RMATAPIRRADRAPGRCWAGGGLLGSKDPTGRFAGNHLNHRGTETQRRQLNLVVLLCASVSLWLILLVLRTQQRRGFGPEATEFLVVGLVPVHPFHGAVVRSAGLVLRAHLPVRHGQEEPGNAVAA